MKKFTSVNEYEARSSTEAVPQSLGSSGLQVVVDKPSTQLDCRWMELKVAGKNITARSHHISAVYKDWLYVHGGCNPDIGTLSDFYRLNLTAKQFVWEKLEDGGMHYPGALKAHNGVVCNNELWIFGGQITESQSSNTVFVYNFETKCWRSLVGPKDLPKLDSHSAIAYKNCMYIFGGYIPDTAKFSASVCKLDLHTGEWGIFHYGDQIDVPGKKSTSHQKYPEPRANCSVVELEGFAWLFGGGNHLQNFNDLWRYDFGSRTWVQIIATALPSPRKCATLTTYGDYLVLFGGIQQITKELNDIHIYSARENQWLKVHSNTNSLYQSSPTLRKSIKNKSPNRQASKNEKKSVGMLFRAPSPEKDPMKRVLIENKLKKFEERKKELLKEFQVNGAEKRQRRPSPTTDNLIKTIKSIGNQEAESSQIVVGHQIRYDASRRFIIGKKPCARDGHTSSVIRDRMLVFGGDRHLICFCDIYFFELGEAIRTREQYNQELRQGPVLMEAKRLAE